MHFERHLVFQNAYNYIFPENLRVSPVNLGREGLPKIQIFFYCALNLHDDHRKI